MMGQWTASSDLDYYGQDPREVYEDDQEDPGEVLQVGGTGCIPQGSVTVPGPTEDQDLPF